MFSALFSNTKYSSNKDHRSLIDSKFLINEALAVILICSYESSRTIYIESQNARNERIIAEYSITFLNYLVPSPQSAWEYRILSSTKETTDSIQRFKKLSHQAEVYQIGKDNLQHFTTSMDFEVERGKIDVGKQDKAIISALDNIGITDFEFSRYGCRGCVVS